MEKDLTKFTNFVGQFSQITRDAALKKWQEIEAFRRQQITSSPEVKEKPLTAEETITTTKVIKTPKIELKDHLKALNTQEKGIYNAEKLRVDLEREKSNYNILLVKVSEKDKEISALKVSLAQYQDNDSKALDLIESLRSDNETQREKIKSLQKKIYNQTQKMKNLANEFEV